jgi:hypothetical protein
VTISLTPVANSWPSGHIKRTKEPNIVSLEELMTPLPGFSIGQSAEYMAINPAAFCNASDLNFKIIFPESADNMNPGNWCPVNPEPG